MFMELSVEVLWISVKELLTWKAHLIFICIMQILAWGNIIDQVHYADSLPWPMEADGEGPYLQLKDLDFDNSLAENWTIGDDLTRAKEFADNQNIAIYPNPTSSKVYVELSEAPIRCQILNLTGDVVLNTAVSNPRFELDLNHLTSGLYVMKVQMTDGKSVYEKVVKR